MDQAIIRLVKLLFVALLASACSDVCDDECNAETLPVEGSATDFRAGPLTTDTLTISDPTTCARTTEAQAVVIHHDGRVPLRYGSLAQEGDVEAGSWLQTHIERLRNQGIVVSVSGWGLPCDGEGGAVLYISTYDWLSADILAADLGQAMAEDDLLGTLELRIEPEYALCPQVASCRGQY